MDYLKCFENCEPVMDRLADLTAISELAALLASWMSAMVGRLPEVKALC